LPFQVLIFSKSNCCDFIAKDVWFPIYPNSIHRIIMFRKDDGGDLSQATTKPQTVFEFKDAL